MTTDAASTVDLPHPLSPIKGHRIQPRNQAMLPSDPDSLATQLVTD